MDMQEHRGILVLVPTPIGNLGDLSPRSLEALREADFIAAEDTRNTLKLLTHFGISKPMISYYEHNKRERGEIIVNRIEQGETCALVTDAGTPAISDPGEDIVRLCAERGVTVTSLPGPCAAIVALTLSGLATGRFVFEGFVSVNRRERGERLAELQNERRTIIFYEAPHKLRTTLDDFAAVFGGDRKVTLCRELTKLHEEVLHTDLDGARALYAEENPRGEYVLILEGAKETNEGAFWEKMEIPEHVQFYEEQGMKRMDALKACARDRGVSKSDIYRAVQQSEDEG